MRILSIYIGKYYSGIVLTHSPPPPNKILIARKTMLSVRNPLPTPSPTCRILISLKIMSARPEVTKGQVTGMREPVPSTHCFRTLTRYRNSFRCEPTDSDRHEWITTQTRLRTNLTPFAAKGTAARRGPILAVCKLPR